MAASYNVIGYLMLGHMGPIMQQVVGNLKTPTTILCSVLIFGNSCTLVQIAGFVMVATGTYIYGQKGKEIKPESVESTKEGYAKGPVVEKGGDMENNAMKAGGGRHDSKDGSQEPIGKGRGDIEMGA